MAPPAGIELLGKTAVEATGIELFRWYVFGANKIELFRWYLLGAIEIKLFANVAFPEAIGIELLAKVEFPETIEIELFEGIPSIDTIGVVLSDTAWSRAVEVELLVLWSYKKENSEYHPHCLNQKNLSLVSFD